MLNISGNDSDEQSNEPSDFWKPCTTNDTIVHSEDEEKEKIAAAERKRSTVRKEPPGVVFHPARDICIKCGLDLECQWYDGVGAELLRMADNLRDADAVRNNRETRFACYQNYVNIMHGWDQKGLRFPLPSCIEKKIKMSFPNEAGDEYVGFKRQKTK